LKPARPFWLPGSAGALYALYFPPSPELDKHIGVLCVPAFAEEMNKSRRMVALQAREFASRGFGVLVIDHFGTGDSEGDFGDATWDIWCEDIRRGWEWLKRETGDNVWLWGVRAGSLIGIELVERDEIRPARILFWQPILKGEIWFSQFLRLRLAAGMIAGGERESKASLWQALDRGESIEVAGYHVGPGLARGLSAAVLEKGLREASCMVHWLELTARESLEAAPATRMVLEKLEGHGVQLELEIIRGDSFWCTQEITVVPELIQRTVNIAERMA